MKTRHKPIAMTIHEDVTGLWWMAQAGIIPSKRKDELTSMPNRFIYVSMQPIDHVRSSSRS